MLAGHGAQETNPGLSVLVPVDKVSRLVGKQGAGLKAIREASGQKVSVTPEEGCSRLLLSGTVDQMAVGFAVAMSRTWAEEPSVAVELRIPNEWAGKIIGKGGENMKRVRAQFNVQTTMSRDPVMNPSTGAQERPMTLTGPGAALAQSLAALLGAQTAQTQMISSPQLFHGGGHGSGHGGGGHGGGANVAALKDPSQALMFGSAPPMGDASETHFGLAVPDSMAGTVLGKGGATIKNMMAASGCRLKMTARGEGGQEAPRRLLFVGQLEGCLVVQQMLWDVLREAFMAAGHPEPTAFSITFWLRKEVVGQVIGKGGQVVQEIRQRSSTQIRVSDYEDGGMRPCQIEGPLENVFNAERLIWQMVMSGPTIDTQAAKRTSDPSDLAFLQLAKRPRIEDLSAPPAPQGEFESRILLQNEVIGLVIGKQGAKLKAIRESSQCKIEVLQAEQAPHYPGERMVVIRGKTHERQSALQQILGVAGSSIAQQNTGSAITPFKILVPVNKVGLVVGDGGSTMTWLSDTFNVQPHVANLDIDGEHLFTVRGATRDVIEASKQICSLLDAEQGSSNGGNSGHDPALMEHLQHVAMQQLGAPAYDPFQS